MNRSSLLQLGARATKAIFGSTNHLIAATIATYLEMGALRHLDEHLWEKAATEALRRAHGSLKSTFRVYDLAACCPLLIIELEAARDEEDSKRFAEDDRLRKQANKEAYRRGLADAAAGLAMPADAPDPYVSGWQDGRVEMVRASEAVKAKASAAMSALEAELLVQVQEPDTAAPTDTPAAMPPAHARGRRARPALQE